MVIASAAPLPRLALLLCGAALATFVVRSKPGAVEDSNTDSSFLLTLTKLEGELESFMKAQHDEMAPEVTAHEYEEKMAADVEKLEENAPETLSSIADRIDALDDHMEEFLEENHEELMPDVTAHDVEQRVVPELIDELEELEEKITGSDEESAGPEATEAADDSDESADGDDDDDDEA